MRKPTKARWGSDGVVLASRWGISAVLHRHPELISRHCTPVACDTSSRALLYDVDEAERVLAGLVRWSPKRRTKPASCE